MRTIIVEPYNPNKPVIDIDIVIYDRKSGMSGSATS